MMYFLVYIAVWCLPLTSCAWRRRALTSDDPWVACRGCRASEADRLPFRLAGAARWPYNLFITI